MSMKLLLIFLLGIGILVGAILLNVISSSLHVTNWYEFVTKRPAMNTISYIWLFILYPLGLGVIAYALMKVLNI